MNYCVTGTWSSGKQDACTVCEEGYECVGTIKKACEANKWSSRGDGICKFFDGTLSGYATSGSWDGSGIAQFETCPDGEFSLYGTITCTTCPVGHYCPNDRKDRMPKTCEPGFYQDGTGEISCKTCVSSSGAPTYSTFGATFCHPTPDGYQLESNNPDEVPQICPVGSYSNASTNYECTACSDSYLCQEGSVADSPTNSVCPYGLFC